MKTALNLALSNGSAFAVAVAVTAEGEPVKRVQLFPIGDITARDGRKWRIRDQAHAKAIVAASVEAAGPTDMPIDYDHQLVFGAVEGVGGKAPASGWMSGLVAEPDGIWADVEWTAAADAQLRAKEYRYISPYFSFDPKSRDITRLWHAGLTNFPAITELAAVASSELSGDTMNLTALAAALGLPATATLEEIVAAASAARTAAAAASTGLATIAAAAGVTGENLTVEAVASAVTAHRTAGAVDTTQWAPMSQLVAANARISALENTGAEEKAAAAVDAAIAAGKVTPANRDWAMGYAKKDLAGFNTFAGNAPAIVGQQQAAAAGKIPAGEITLTAEEKATASAFGITEEAMLASKKELA